MEHLQRFGITLIQWVHIFRRESPALSILCAMLFIGGSILGAYYFCWRKRSLYSWTALGFLFTAVYSVFILIMAVITAFQPLDSRLLSPLCFPALGAAAGALLSVINRLGPGSRTFKTARACSGLVVMIFLFQGFSREVRYLRLPDEVYRDNIRYDFSIYRQSLTLKFINTHPGLFHSDKPIYSNAGEVLYVLSGLESDYLPRLDLPAEIRSFNSDTAWLVWLHAAHAYTPGYLPDLKKVSPIVPIYEFPDGIIFSTLSGSAGVKR